VSLRAVLSPKIGVAALVLLAACGNLSSSSASGRPSIVVTTSVLGDVVENLVGDQAAVDVLMPRGADPHEASLSSRQADEMSRADLVVVNGAGFEQNMRRVIDSVEADGTPVVRVADGVDLLPFPDGDDEDGPDPHFWTDPTRMATAARVLAGRLADLDGIDPAALDEDATRYLAQLAELDTEVAEALAPVPDDERVLVTNHEVFGYFADRYGFRVVGAVIPAGTTQAEPSSSEVSELADVVRDTGVPAIFAETSSPATLARALADEAGDVEVVDLFSESLGEPGSGGATYVQMMRTNAERIAEALT
jgi:zinc/manganese transport system substrate-binding protein